MPPLKRHENSPAPPPPSPEPAQKSIKTKPSDNSSEAGMNGSAICTDSPRSDGNAGGFGTATTTGDVLVQDAELEGSKLLNPEHSVVPANKSELETSQQLPDKGVELSAMTETLQTNDEEVHQVSSSKVETSTGATGQSEAPVELLEPTEKEREDKLTINMELSNKVTPSSDALSMVPDALYKELDGERLVPVVLLCFR